MQTLEAPSESRRKHRWADHCAAWFRAVGAAVQGEGTVCARAHQGAVRPTSCSRPVCLGAGDGRPQEGRLGFS